MLKKLITISITAIVSLQAATTYNKSLSDGNSNLNYWSDTTNSNLTNHTLVGATEVFTIGSRYNIPNVPTPIKVSTNKLCSNDKTSLVSCSKFDSLEPRYTDDGLNTSGESNLRTWYKAATPKSVNGVVDDPCTSLSNTGSVVNWWADFSNLRCERTIATYTPKVNSTIYTAKVNSDIFANKSSYNTTDTQTPISNWAGGKCILAVPNYSHNTTSGSIFTNYNMESLLNIIGKSVPVSGGVSPKYDIAQWNPGAYGSYNRWGNKAGSSLSTISWSSTCTLISIRVERGGGPPLNYGTINLQPNTESTSAFNGYNISSAALSCNSGYSLSGNICTKTNTVYTCPSGYVDNGSNCKQTIQICPDASWTSATATTCSKVVQVCPDASWTDNGTNCRKNVPEYRLFSTF